jgi:hypothetical protein
MGASVDVQSEILGQMRKAGVRVIRTNIRPADRYIDFAKRAYAQGIRIVAIFDLQFPPDTATNPKQLPPLSVADPRLSETYFQTLLGDLEAQGVVLAGIELGNEINWTPSNGDLALPGSGLVMGLRGLQDSPEGKKVAQGYLQYLKVLAALKNVRDRSRLNRRTPIILGGLANNGAPRIQINGGMDGVSIDATITFMRAHGLDSLVDAYGLHFYPWMDTPAHRKANLEENVVAQCRPANAGGKACWITEWGVRNPDASCSAKDDHRPAIVAETMNNYRALARQGRLTMVLYYTWNSNPATNQLDPMSVFRCGSLTEAGRLAIAP